MSAGLKVGAHVGRYALMTRIARGGMADVWLARASGAVGFEKTVVIKTILPQLSGDPEFVRMFIDEAIVAARLEHPNIVHIFDLGEDDGSYFIAMEYIAGRSLRHLERELRKSRRVPPTWLVLSVAAAVCDALHYAHNKLDESGAPMHLVHRDISPENVMVTFTGDTKVLDFGIAKATTAVSKTRAGVLKGKYPYMAPEQIENAMEGTAPDPRIDLYSLGVVMYELITGRRPFRAHNDLALMRQILDTSPEPPASFCNWVSPELSDLVLRAMARAPGQRYQTAPELRSAIEAYFQASGGVPMRRHVADYVRSLFGEGSEPMPAAAGDDLGSGKRAVQTDPWAVHPAAGGDEDAAVTIDLSMVLIADDETSDKEPLSRRSPAGEGAAGLPVSSVDEGWEELSPDLGDSGESTERAGAEAAGGECGVPDVAPAVREHLWDRVTRKAREERNSISPDAVPEAVRAGEPVPERGEGSRPARERHSWDAVVGRLRGGESAERPAKAAESSAGDKPKGATAWFEQGLEHLRAKEPQRALECWTKALELEPGNRVYQSNLRVLKRQLSREPGA